MKPSEKIEKILTISPETAIHEMLFDLLKKIGYTDVTLTHERGNVPENGKDIVCSTFNPLDNKKEWTAFVVKKGNIKGTSTGVQEVRAQIDDCFRYSWNSLAQGKNIKINKVKVVATHKFTSGAVTKILGDDYFSNPNVSFWGVDEIVEALDKYYPIYWQEGSRIYKKYIEIFLEKSRENELSKAISIKGGKIKSILEVAMQPRLYEIATSDEGEVRKRSYDVHDLAMINDNCVIVGPPGSGKSTLFKLLSNDIIKQNSIRGDYELYPLIIRFSDLVQCDFDFKKVLENHFENNDYTDFGLDAEILLANQNFILFIDALDEVGTSDLKERALQAVQDFKQTFPKVRIYCTSRPADSLHSSCQKLKFRFIEIDSVSNKQAEQYIDRYFDGDQAKCKRLLKSLKDSNILEKLPKTPLTLALITAIFDENEIEIPATISDIYKHFVDLLLTKSVKNTTDLLAVGVHRSVLSFIAEYLHINKVTSVAYTKLTTLVSNFAAERGHKYDVDKLLEDILADIGVLIKNERSEVEFKHLSFQEYFTAYQFYNHNINGKDNFINNFNDLWWQNVAIFYAGMTKDSPELIDAILKNSVPKNFREYLMNLSGIGYLIQALYNTKIDTRVMALKRNTNNAKKALDFLLSHEGEEYNILRSLYKTRFGAFWVTTHWFEFHHNSITLKDPLLKYFNELAVDILSLDVNSKDREYKEFEAFFIANTITEIDDSDLTIINQLLNITNPKNYLVTALIDSYISNKIKKMSNEQKRSNAIRRLSQQIDHIDRKKIAGKVNVTLLEGKIVPSFKK
ncbi:MAG TPA: NACHT domain-containing protein [Bacteroidia bacterium]|nr:NACHT domain-containing protein [Bacteroidia bacterium]